MSSLRWLVIPTLGALLSGIAPRSGSDDEPTYHADIQPILARKCLPCHQPGGPSPFTLDTYADVKRRGTLIRWVCIVGSMPPVDANSDLAPMAAVDRLRDDELQLIQEWVHTGAKEGKPTPPAATPPVAWRLSQAPDVVLRPSRPGTLREEGAPYRKLFILGPGAAAGRTIVAFDIKPNQPFVWRHAYLAVVPQGVKPEEAFTPTGVNTKTLVGAWAPGHFAWSSPEGVPVAKDAVLVVSALIQPSGKQEDAGFELGIRTSDPPKAPLEWITLGSKEFAIAPADGGQTLHAETVLEHDVDLVSVVPECRLFAQQVRVEAVLPSGESKRILVVQSWDLNWQGAYQPAKPVRLLKGTKITAEIDYDNSGHSGGNREARPTTSVRFGPGDGDDLFWVHLQVIPRVVKE